MGDESKGLKSQVQGCIALGRSIGTIVGQKAVTSSRDALAAFVADLEKQPFRLHIAWDKGVKLMEG